MALPSPPLRPHGSSALELKQRLKADRNAEPYLLLRDDLGRQRIVVLGVDRDRLTVGRSEAADVSLSWDHAVSRVHALIERMADGWALIDDGLSRNGSYVNHERVHGRRLLRDGDTLEFGKSVVAFRDLLAGRAETTVAALDRPAPPRVSSAQRRVLVALCRPYARGDAFPVPATNQQIAEELVVGVEAVKSQLCALFHLFAVDRVPRQERRVRLVERAFGTGAVTVRDFGPRQ